MNKAPKQSRLLLWIGIALIFFGSIFAFVGYISIKNEMAYEASGATVTGVVTGKYIDERWETDSQTKKRTKHTTYYIKYKFEPGSRESIEASDSVDSSSYESINSGDNIDIQFIPSDLSKNRIAGQNDYTAGYLFSAIGGIIILAGVCLAGFDMKRKMLHKRLMADGMMAEAEIVSVNPGNLSVNGVIQWLVEYKFRDIRGQEQKGKSSHLPPEFAETFNIGEKIRVRYDRNDPAKNIWVTEN